MQQIGVAILDVIYKVMERRKQYFLFKKNKRWHSW